MTKKKLQHQREQKGKRETNGAEEEEDTADHCATLTAQIDTAAAQAAGLHSFLSNTLGRSFNKVPLLLLLLLQYPFSLYLSISISLTSLETNPTLLLLRVLKGCILPWPCFRSSTCQS